MLVNMKVLVKEDTKHNATDQTIMTWVFQPLTHCPKCNMACMNIWIPIDACADTAECLCNKDGQ